jgi:hypothetical protein
VDALSVLPSEDEFVALLSPPLRLVFPEEDEDELLVLRLTKQNKRTTFNKRRSVPATATPTTTLVGTSLEAAEAASENKGPETHIKKEVRTTELTI